MNLIDIYKKLNKFVKNRLKIKPDLSNKSVQNNPTSHSDNDNPIPTIFDGMGSATATEIIKRRIDRHIFNEYGIQGLENTGRYYTASVSEANGSIIHTFIVDKQNGMVRTLHRKVASKSLS